MRIFKRVMLMLVVGVVFKRATLSPNVKNKLPLRRLVGVFKRVMLVVYLFLLASILIYNRMVLNHQ